MLTFFLNFSENTFEGNFCWNIWSCLVLLRRQNRKLPVLLKIIFEGIDIVFLYYS